MPNSAQSAVKMTPARLGQMARQPSPAAISPQCTASARQVSLNSSFICSGVASVIFLGIISERTRLISGRMSFHFSIQSFLYTVPFCSQRKLAKGKNNDVVRLAFLEPGNLEVVDRLDLTGVAEFKRNANGALEVKFVDRVKVLAMLRELLDQEDGALEAFLDELERPEGGGA